MDMAIIMHTVLKQGVGNIFESLIVCIIVLYIYYNIYILWYICSSTLIDESIFLTLWCEGTKTEGVLKVINQNVILSAAYLLKNTVTQNIMTKDVRTKVTKPPPHQHIIILIF